MPPPRHYPAAGQRPFPLPPWDSSGETEPGHEGRGVAQEGDCTLAKLCVVTLRAGKTSGAIQSAEGGGGGVESGDPVQSKPERRLLSTISRVCPARRNREVKGRPVR